MKRILLFFIATALVLAIGGLSLGCNGDATTATTTVYVNVPSDREDFLDAFLRETIESYYGEFYDFNSQNARGRKMQALIMELAYEARKINPDFYIVNQDTMNLARSLAVDGNLSSSAPYDYFFLSFIDGWGVESNTQATTLGALAQFGIRGTAIGTVSSWDSGTTNVEGLIASHAAQNGVLYFPRITDGLANRITTGNWDYKNPNIMTGVYKYPSNGQGGSGADFGRNNSYVTPYHLHEVGLAHTKNSNDINHPMDAKNYLYMINPNKYSWAQDQVRTWDEDWGPWGRNRNNFGADNNGRIGQLVPMEGGIYHKSHIRWLPEHLQEYEWWDWFYVRDGTIKRLPGGEWVGPKDGNWPSNGTTFSYGNEVLQDRTDTDYWAPGGQLSINGTTPATAEDMWWAGRAAMIRDLAETEWDMMYIDSHYNDVQAWTPEELALLKTKPQGGRRLVMGYISIGTAEPYRFYAGGDMIYLRPATSGEGFQYFMAYGGLQGGSYVPGNSPERVYDTYEGTSVDNEIVPPWLLFQGYSGQYANEAAVMYWHPGWRNVIARGVTNPTFRNPAQRDFAQFPENASFIQRIALSGFDGTYIDNLSRVTSTVNNSANWPDVHAYTLLNPGWYHDFDFPAPDGD